MTHRIPASEEIILFAYVYMHLHISLHAPNLTAYSEVCLERSPVGGLQVVSLDRSQIKRVALKATLTVSTCAKELRIMDH